MDATDDAPKPTTNRDCVPAHAIARLRTFIEAECSNFGQGRCLPADGPCRVTERQEPCRYFEISVLPIVWMHPAHNRSGEYAAETYAEISPGTLGGLNARRKPRTCPGCGVALPSRKRLCDDCRKKRRLHTCREAARRFRVQSNQLSQASA